MNMLVLVAAWSSLCAVATGALVWFIMDSRMQVRLARQREKLAEARATLETQKQALEGSLQGAQETARRQALDEFLADLRIEERHYVREHKIMFVTRKSLVRQERIFFRNIPLSNWVEQEIPISEGADLDALARTLSVFSPDLLMGPAEADGRHRMLR
jgi:hypothetical protein